VRQLLVKGIFVPATSQVFTLGNGAQALDFQEHGHPKGKVIFNVL
jgi:hypothetical protein